MVSLLPGTQYSANTNDNICSSLSLYSRETQTKQFVQYLIIDPESKRKLFIKGPAYQTGVYNSISSHYNSFTGDGVEY